MDHFKNSPEEYKDVGQLFNENVAKIGLQNHEGGYTLDSLHYQNKQEQENLFEDFESIEPDPVLRPEGNTTIFTTAGIQHLETLENKGESIDHQKFQVAQPVVRSQFMDKIKEGFSTSFVNQSFISTEGTMDDFVNLTQDMIFSALQRDSDISKYSLTSHVEPDRWGDKKFDKLVVTLFYQGVEVSEGLFIRHFPKIDGGTVSVAEVCWGIERFDWVFDKGSNYFKEFQDYYKDKDIESVAKVIDPMRTGVLMLMQGVAPSHKDPGFRLRQLIKRFLERNQEQNLPAKDLFDLSCSFWRKQKVDSVVAENKMFDILRFEMERAFNVYVTAQVELVTGRKMRIDVNLSTKDFVKRIYESAPEDVVDAVRLIEKKGYEM